LKEIGVTKNVADVQKLTLFDSTFDASDPEKYAKSFPVNSLAS